MSAGGGNVANERQAYEIPEDVDPDFFASSIASIHDTLDQESHDPCEEIHGDLSKTKPKGLPKRILATMRIVEGFPGRCLGG